MTRAVLAIAFTLFASSAEAHCFRYWRFPRPQTACGWGVRAPVIHRHAARRPAPVTRVARLEAGAAPSPKLTEPPKPTPIPDLQPWEDLQRIVAIAKLKLELQGAAK